MGEPKTQLTLANEESSTSRELNYTGTALFEVVKSPILKDIARTSVVKFSLEYERYVEQFNNNNFVLGKSLAPSLMKTCFERRLLVDLSTFEFDDKEVGDITEEEVQAWVDGIVGTSLKTNLDDLNVQVKAKLKMDVSIKDPNTRILTLLIAHKRIVKDLGWKDFFTRHPKLGVRQLVASLKPEGFKKIVEKDLEDEKLELLKDYGEFVKYLRKEAIVCERFFPIEKLQPFKSSVETTSKPNVFSKQQVSRNDNDKKKTHFSPRSKSSDQGNKPPPKSSCLKCSGPHWLSDCPVVSQGEQSSLLAAASSPKTTRSGKIYDKDWGNKKAESSEVSKIVMKDKNIATILSLPSGRVSGRLNNILDIPVLLDWGADESCISNFHLMRLMDVGGFVATKTVTKPYSLNGVFGGDSVWINKHASINITIVTVAGKLTLRNVSTTVIDSNHLDCVILGRELLRKVGLDLDKHLLELCSENPILDCSEIEVSSSEKVSKLVATLSSQQANSEDSNHLEDDVVDIGEDGEDEISLAFESMLSKALDEGFPPDSISQLSSLLQEFRDIWRLRLGPDPPVKVAPIKLVLKPGATPVMTKARRYPPNHVAYMKKHVDELVRYGLVYENRNSPWASSPVIVPKPGTNLDFRMTIDVRRVNEQTEPTAWPMPNLEVVFQSLEGSCMYAGFDLFRGYWQLPLHVDSQSCLSFMTDIGIYSPTRVLQGSTGAVAFCQAAIQEIVGDQLYVNALVWLDDILLYSKSLDDFLQVLHKFFSKCRRYGLKLHARKCSLFFTKVKWCGRIISAAGVSQDPSRIQALLSLSTPQTGGDLQQFICALNWMRMSMPNFSKVVAPLQNLLEEVCVLAGGRKKKTLHRFSLSKVGWESIHDRCFEDCKKLLASSCTLSHSKPEFEICVFSDASLDFWGSIVTQIDASQLDLPFNDQCQEPIAFLSGSFRGSASRWSIVEKEAFAIVETCCRLEYLLLRPLGFHIFTDHRNLQFIFNPHGHNPGVQRHTAAKLQRWALKLMCFEYTIEFISGEVNLWADLLSRWGAGGESVPSKAMVAALIAPIAPVLDSRFKLPSLTDILKAQKEFESECSKEMSKDENGFYKDKENRIWIPDSAVDLQMRVCVLAHMGPSGHRGNFSTFSILNDRVFWSSMKEDVRSFVKSCLHCEVSIGGCMVPRPWGEAIHGSEPNEVIHFDYLFMDPSSNMGNYVLVIKEDFSAFCELVVIQSADSISIADALVDWFKRFGVPKVLVSDQGSHFKNQLLDSICEVIGASHHFTLPYAPWSNGTVEVVNREILRITRTLLSEFRLKPRDWPRVLPLVQATLNQTPLERLGGIAPITAFLGLKPSTCLDSLIHPITFHPLSMKDIHSIQRLHVKSALCALDDMHKLVHHRVMKNREKARHARAHARKVQVPNFALGDFVLVAVDVHKSFQKKLVAKWTGPRLITKVISEWVYEVTDLLTQEVALIHSCRLKFYDDAQREISTSLLYQIAHDSANFQVHALLDLRFLHDLLVYEILVSWVGLERSQNS